MGFVIHISKLWCIIKNAVKKIIFLLILWTSFSFGQNIESKKISEVDSICDNINNLKKTEYKTIQGSGLINKKRFFFFDKNIGSFHEDVVCVDKQILKISYTEILNGKTKNEIYYFSKNKLIRYELRTFNKKGESNNDVNSKVYYDNEKLLKIWNDGETNFDFLQTLEKSKELISNYIELQNN